MFTSYADAVKGAHFRPNSHHKLLFLWLNHVDKVFIFWPYWLYWSNGLYIDQAVCIAAMKRCRYRCTRQTQLPTPSAHFSSTLLIQILPWLACNIWYDGRFCVGMWIPLATSFWHSLCEQKWYLQRTSSFAVTTWRAASWLDDLETTSDASASMNSSNSFTSRLQSTAFILMVWFLFCFSW